MTRPIVSAQFRENVRKAIEVLAALPGESADNVVRQALVTHGIEDGDARAILIFLPIAFCRQMLPQLAWKDEYSELRSWPWPKRKKRFSETPTYRVVWEEVTACLARRPGEALVLQIAGRSAEFHVINQLLNAGGKMEDILLTPMVIVW